MGTNLVAANYRINLPFRQS